ncbi:hypothetical protein [Olivibacter sp. XZL3]|nr:hypothetical protein [Olivibacter sp. XZL3]
MEELDAKGWNIIRHGTGLNLSSKFLNHFIPAVGQKLIAAAS